MENYFNLLEVKPSIQIDLEILSANHKKISASHHPDLKEKNRDDSQYRLINQAFTVLKSPSKRLIHLLELADIPYEKRGTVSDHLMDLFMSTAHLLQETDAFLRKKSATTSILAKALLESESQELQDSISNQIDAIETEKKLTLENADLTENLANAARDLAFLEKWQAQLKERYASLF